MKKSRYSTLQNTVFMIRTAWQTEKSVLFLCLALILWDVLLMLVNLFAPPVILEKVETGVPIPELLTSIALFGAALVLLQAAKAYTDTNTMSGRISVRMKLIELMSIKCATTSYENLFSEKIWETRGEAFQCTNGNNQASEAIWKTLVSLGEHLIGFLIYALVLGTVQPILLLVTFLAAAAGFLVNEHGNRRMRKTEDAEATDINRMDYLHTAAKQESGLGKDIRLFGMGAWLDDLHKSTENAYRLLLRRKMDIRLLDGLLNIVFTFLRGGFAYYYLITLTLRENLPAPAFLLYFTAAGGFGTWVQSILTDFSTLHEQCRDLSYIRTLLDTPEPFRFTDGEALALKPDGKYTLELRDVSFRYPGTDHDLIRHMNLTIRPGEKLAVVGRNGAGKTTLVKLLCGFYDPTGGAVLLNGRDIREFNRQDYYRLFGAVFQDFSVLAVSLAENVSQSQAETNLDRVQKCLEEAGLAEKVQSLPKGYDTQITRNIDLDGTELSGGELQKLMLARSLYKNAPILMLDEPTAALDALAETEIYEKYQEMTQGRTAVFISHRLASTRFCDRILYLEDGEIKEEGTHESLMAAKGSYANLFEIQSRYYKKNPVSEISYEGGAVHAQ